MTPQKPVQKRPIEQVKADNERELLRIKGVQGVGIGLDEKTSQRVIKIYVDKRTRALEKRLPSELEGYAVRIEATGEFRAF